MDVGEWLTRGTVWAALTLYVASELASARFHSSVAKWLNTVGCLIFLTHVACAFQFYHHWSHADAYAETARQTAQMTGMNSGAGLYLNYLFAIVWIVEVIWSHLNPVGFQASSKWSRRFVRFFFFFMFFNGAFVFAKTFMRWFGLLLCITLLYAWWPRAKSGVDRNDSSTTLTA